MNELKHYPIFYEDELTTLYLGDCAEIFPQLGLVDAVVTDPPYGIKENDRKQKSREQLAKPTEYGIFNWDDKPPERWLLDMFRSRSKQQIIFGGNFFELPPASCYLVWDKDNSGDFADCELAWTNIKKAIRKLKYRWNGMIQENMTNKEVRLHPTQKPVAVMEWCLSHLEQPQVIVDPYAGSGSTLIAARRLGIRNIGIEFDERYCQIIADTLNGNIARWIKGGATKPESQHITESPLFASNRE